MIPKPDDTNWEVPVNETFHVQTDDELAEKELKQIEADDQAIQTILLGLPEDIYAVVDSCETAQEIWFTSNDEESIESYYHRFLKLMNDLKRNKHFPEKIANPLALMETSNNPYSFPVLNQDQPSFNQNYMQQPIPNPEDIADPTTTMNMALALMAKAFKLNYSTPTNNNQRISSNPRNRQIAQPDMNMGQDRQMQMVGGNGENQFRQYAGQNVGNLNGYNAVQNVSNQVIQNGAQNLRVQNIGNQNGLIGVTGNANQNQNENGNLVAARAEENAAGHNGNQIRCYNCRRVGHFARNCTVRPRRRDAAYLQTQLLIAQKEEAGIQLQAKKFDLMAAAADLDEIEKVNAKSILMANLQQASTSVKQHPVNVEETRALYDSLYHNLAIEVEKVDTVNRKLKETNAYLTTELARFKNQEKCFKISQEKYDKLERCYQQSVYKEQCLSKKINALHLSFGKQIMTLNEEISDLNKQLSKEKSTVFLLLEEKKKLKSVFKTREDELLDKQIQLEKKIKELNNILVKTEETLQLAQESREKMKQLNKEIKLANYTKINHLSWVFVSRTAKSHEELYFSNDSKMATVSKSISIPNEEFSDDTTPSVARKFLNEGNILITRVYFVEGLGHNLFSVGQFCDSDLEVAFRRNECFVRNLEGVDLLKGNRATNLYTINLHDMASASPICLMAHASFTKSWLWHQRLSHLNFDTINDLAKNDLFSVLPKFKYHKEHLCPSCEQVKIKRASHPPKPVPNSRQRLHLPHMDLCGPMRIASINGKRYVLVIVEDYSCYTWVHFLRFKDEAPDVIKTFLKRITVLLQSLVIIIRTDNGTKIKTLKYTLIVLASLTKCLMSEHLNKIELWNDEIGPIATACFTQNRSIIHRRFNKTPYKLINDRKPDISFLHVFGDLCYPKNDREDIGKLGAKAMAFEQSSSKPGLQSMTSGQISSGLDLTYAPSTITTQQPSEGELALLSEAMYDDFIGGQPSATARSVPAAQAPQVRQTSTTSTSIADSAPTPTNSSSFAINFPSSPTNADLIFKSPK
nr:retrovirus-related Pol polyprotein from transposon TNT 1-94 [Tanacetum cinerariifolium]